MDTCINHIPANSFGRDVEFDQITHFIESLRNLIQPTDMRQLLTQTIT
jgi:hypothetical protein